MKYFLWCHVDPICNSILRICCNCSQKNSPLKIIKLTAVTICLGDTCNVPFCVVVIQIFDNVKAISSKPGEQNIKAINIIADNMAAIVNNDVISLKFRIW